MFTLTLPITTISLDILKQELTRAWPLVKSSHRCEALARGFGFRTYAAMLAASRAAVPPNATANGQIFSDYLAGHSFEVPPKALYHAGAAAALAGAMDAVPQLTMWGYGVGQPDFKDGRWETARERAAKFAEQRAALVSDYSAEPFLAALAYVSRIEKTKTIRSGTGSYGLKHMAEKFACTYPEGDSLGPVYVANGLLIAAAVHAGFRFKTHSDLSGFVLLNVSFNMSKPSRLELDYEIQPETRPAQERHWRQGRRQDFAYA